MLFGKNYKVKREKYSSIWFSFIANSSWEPIIEILNMKRNLC